MFCYFDINKKTRHYLIDYNFKAQLRNILPTKGTESPKIKNESNQ